MTVAADAPSAVEPTSHRGRLDGLVVPAVTRVGLPLLCLAGAAFASGSLDLDLFATAGRAMLHGQLGAVYSDADVQAGPLQLLVAAVLTVGGAVNTPALLVRLALTAVAVVGVLVLLQRRGPMHPVRRCAVALGVGLWFVGGGAWGGHPAELLIPLAWVGAALATRGGRWVLAGAAVAGAAAIAPWGLLGAPVLLGAGLRSGIRAGAVALLGAIAAYLPFLLTGHFAMFGHAWPIGDDTLVHLLVPSAAHFGWAGRLGQGAIVLGGCLLTMRVAGRHWIVAVPLAAALLRLATDPVQLNYYWTPVGVLAVVALAAGRRDRSPAPALVAAAYVPWLAYSAALGPVWAAGFVVASGVVVFHRSHRSPTRNGLRR